MSILSDLNRKAVAWEDDQGRVKVLRDAVFPGFCPADIEDILTSYGYVRTCVIPDYVLGEVIIYEKGIL